MAELDRSAKKVMKAFMRIALGAVVLDSLSFYVLYHFSIAAVYFLNVPAMLVSGILSGNIHAPHPAAFAFASFGQWALVLWFGRFVLARAKRRRRLIQRPVPMPGRGP